MEQAKLRPIMECKRRCGELGLDFIGALDEYLTDGWVYSGEECFVMAKVASRESLFELNLNKGLDKDTWFVYAFVGNMKRLMEIIPFRLKYIAFCRDNGAIRVYEADKLLARLEKV